MSSSAKTDLLLAKPTVFPELVRLMLFLGMCSRMHTLLKDEFLHYLGVIEGRGDGLWAVVYNNIELECLPKDVGHCCGTEF